MPKITGTIKSNQKNFITVTASPQKNAEYPELVHQFSRFSTNQKKGHEERHIEKATMNVAELSKQLGISKPKAYELVRQNGFPCLNIGRRIIIPVEAFNIWLMKSSGINN
ncbi:helix-turn-helix domain-containing protein [Acetobacterium woodii]|uniref:Helix-turn-helix domain-containing protein n=1 Tax=Acetobacterium woodii (strain ATCC 29683 / DSM 1030 / JCM 2381 / KCTC 1655 / WB1) TaxID=931626 RepID=H6LF40_ACEWD|nr:helix-turn-helix domain-containing protein [Acetobacterium woodii]AFA46946.1 hypothetical protein Awo_c01370 [Acetobacterium woodii DSM 1030]